MFSHKVADEDVDDLEPYRLALPNLNAYSDEENILRFTLVKHLQHSHSASARSDLSMFLEKVLPEVERGTRSSNLRLQQVCNLILEIRSSEKEK